MEVEFDVETEESGKLKCINVTLPGGAPIQPSALPRRQSSAADAAETEKAPPKPKEIPFHSVIPEDLKAKIEANGLILGDNTTIDVSLNDARIKLGQGGYASMALVAGVIAEGTYVCDETATITFSWEHVLKVEGDAWVPATTDSVMSSFSLADGTCDVQIGKWCDIANATIDSSAAAKPVDPTETAESLWGEDKPDPKDFFADNGFKMKRVVLSRPPGNRGGGGRRYRPRRNNGGS